MVPAGPDCSAGRLCAAADPQLPVGCPPSSLGLEDPGTAVGGREAGGEEEGCPIFRARFAVIGNSLLVSLLGKPQPSG